MATRRRADPSPVRTRRPRRRRRPAGRRGGVRPSGSRPGRCTARGSRSSGRWPRAQPEREAGRRAGRGGASVPPSVSGTCTAPTAPGVPDLTGPSRRRQCVDRREFLAAASAPLVLGLAPPASRSLGGALHSRSSLRTWRRRSSSSTSLRDACSGVLRRPPTRGASSVSVTVGRSSLTPAAARSRSSTPATRSLPDRWRLQRAAVHRRASRREAGLRHRLRARRDRGRRRPEGRVVSRTPVGGPARHLGIDRPAAACGWRSGTTAKAIAGPRSRTGRPVRGWSARSGHRSSRTTSASRLGAAASG